MKTVYDEIGKGYIGKRSADPSIYAAVRSQIGASKNIVNVGAGTGSYEPVELNVVAVEPSMTMISQRPSNAAPVIQAFAENLPFQDNCFDLSMAILTLHHWSDWKRGLSEAARVSGGNVLLLTWFGFRQNFWLTDYFPEIAKLDSSRFPRLKEYEQILGEVSVTKLPIPHDCTDGFMCAYWRRPAAYLDPRVRNSISTFSMISNQKRGLASLKYDLSSGKWNEKYGDLLESESYDYGYRLVYTKG
jgi:SAM-dependent methyltransferase